MPKFRKKPVEVEAVQVLNAEYTRVSDMSSWDRPFSDWPAWIVVAVQDGRLEAHADGDTDYLQWRIKTLEGVMNAGPRDWIIQGIKGELYPCRDDIFRATYEPVS